MSIIWNLNFLDFISSFCFSVNHTILVAFRFPTTSIIRYNFCNLSSSMYIIFIIKLMMRHLVIYFSVTRTHIRVTFITFHSCRNIRLYITSDQIVIFRRFELVNIDFYIISIQLQARAIARHRIPPLELIVRVIEHDNLSSIIIRKLINSVKHLFLLQFFPSIF